MTVHKETWTYTGNGLNPLLMYGLASKQESHRALLTPDEVLRLPPDAALVFVSGSRPIFGRKLHYFRDPSFAARARIPAEHKRYKRDFCPRMTSMATPA
jgi:type IV secretion system protein VirD4